MGEFPRRPTKEERDLLDFVVEANPDHAAALHSLFRNTQVTQLCSCGCGSPHFSVDTSDVRKRTWPHPLPEEAVALVEGALMMAMLWADLDGGNLEINWMDIPDPRDHARLPRLTELEVARWQPHGETGRVLTNFRPAAR